MEAVIRELHVVVERRFQNGLSLRYRQLDTVNRDLHRLHNYSAYPNRWRSTPPRGDMLTARPPESSATTADGRRWRSYLMRMTGEAESRFASTLRTGPFAGLRCSALRST